MNNFKVGDYVICPNSYRQFWSIFKIISKWNDDIILKKVIYPNGIEELERCDITIKPGHNIKLVPYTEVSKILYASKSS